MWWQLMPTSKFITHHPPCHHLQIIRINFLNTLSGVHSLKVWRYLKYLGCYFTGNVYQFVVSLRCIGVVDYVTHNWFWWLSRLCSIRKNDKYYSNIMSHNVVSINTCNFCVATGKKITFQKCTANSQYGKQNERVFWGYKGRHLYLMNKYLIPLPGFEYTIAWEQCFIFNTGSLVILILNPDDKYLHWLM